MKKTFIVIIQILAVFFTQAQRFFYVESNPVTDRILYGGLLKGNQFVSNSPLGSDYIIKTDVGVQTESNSLLLKITLQDSITLKMIFQSSEEYGIDLRNKNSRLYLRMLVQTFIEKNISQIIVSAKDDHFDGQAKYLKARKDKT